jgi:hypothetical protein
MALLKQTDQNTIPSSLAGVIAEQAATQVVEQESETFAPPQVVEQEPQAFAAPALVPTSADVPVVNGPLSGATLATLQQSGFEGLAFDWTSFPIISLKNEGRFEDFDNTVYGSEFHCRIQGSKRRWVFRGAPVQDNKRDVAYSYDKLTTQSGASLAEITAEWRKLGKVVEEKEYLEVLVEMVAPGLPHDGEFRILSLPPTAIGRFSGHVAKAAARGNGNPGAVITRGAVGPKITKVQNAFYPWLFEVVK